MFSQQQILELRKEFPILNQNIYGSNPLIYLDNAATSQTPKTVVEAIEKVYYTNKSNVHRGVHCLSQRATEAMERGRESVRRFLNAKSANEIVFTRGTTEAINLVASSLGQTLNRGDLIVITEMEHHSNIVPWQFLERSKGIKIKAVPVDEEGKLDIETYRELLSEKPKVVSVTHISNVLGTVNPIKTMAAEAHRAGALFVCDGAQAVPHVKIDVEDLDVDFYAFSAHKMYGPTGIGALYGKKELLETLPPYQGGGEMISHVSIRKGSSWAEIPYKFEAGTPDFTGASVIGDAIDFMETLGIENIHEYENYLLHYATDSLFSNFPEIRIFGTAEGKASVISFLLGTAHHYDTGILLDQLGIAARTGHHCAQPLMERYGIEGTVRISFAIYNTISEIDTFISALRRISPMLLG